MVRVEDDAEIPESGAVFTFGKSKFADNVPSKFWIRNDVIKNVACGDEHSVAITGNGRIYVFGSNEWGQLGVSNKKTVTKPYCLKALKHEKAISAAGGRAHTLITTESGKVYSFGGNSEGQLGLVDNDNRIEPCLISGIEAHVVAVAAGSYHSVLLTVDGIVYVFGSNSEGQLGLGDIAKVSSPTKLDLESPISKVACGYYHTALITRDGKVLTFGEKDSGKLGLLEKQLTDQGATSKPQCIFSITEKVVSASCGGNHTAVLTECGKLYTFGSGLNGQLGLGTMIMETASPSLVGALDGEKIVEVGCGESHTAIITEQGKMYTCGDGRHGKLGLGDENFSNQFNPVFVKKFSGYFVHQVACGGCHMLVLASKQTTEELDKESSNLTEEQMTDDTNNVRSRRRLKDLQGNLVPTLPQSFGRPLPPLGTNINELLSPTKQKTSNDGEILQEMKTEDNNTEDLNGNFAEIEKEITKEIENITQVSSPIKQVLSSGLSSASAVLKSDSVPHQAVSKALSETVLKEPIITKVVEEKKAPQLVDIVNEKESESSEEESSSDEEKKKTPYKIECEAVIEPKPPPSTLTQPAPTETAKKEESRVENKQENPKPVKKKFWSFGRKKTIEDESSTMETLKSNAEKEGPKKAEAPAKPPRSATSIFSRSVNNSEKVKTDESIEKKTTTTTTKSSACAIL